MITRKYGLCELYLFAKILGQIIASHLSFIDQVDVSTSTDSWCERLKSRETLVQNSFPQEIYTFKAKNTFACMQNDKIWDKPTPAPRSNFGKNMQ